MSRDCPEGGNSRGFSSGRGGNSYGGAARSCYNCGESGHMSRDCTSGGNGGNNGGYSSGGQKCYNCGNSGHISRDCDQPAQAKTCYKCQQSGHIVSIISTNADLCILLIFCYKFLGQRLSFSRVNQLFCLKICFKKNLMKKKKKKSIEV